MYFNIHLLLMFNNNEIYYKYFYRHLMLCISPISMKCESNKNINRESKENMNIKNICNTIKEVYRLNNREKIIRNSIYY